MFNSLIIIAPNSNVHQQMKGHIMINPHNGILPGNKRNAATDIHNPDNLNNIVLSQRSQTKKSTC